MNLDDYLDTVQLLDCEGKVTATLVLQPNGTVSIRRSSGPTVMVDPTNKTVLTPGISIDSGLLDAAAAMAR